MKWADIVGFMKNGKSWAQIKAAQEYFESQEDIDAFLASGWTIEDLAEAKEMIETNPTAAKIEPKVMDHVATQIENSTGLEIPENENHYALDDEVGSTFKKLAKGEL